MTMTAYKPDAQEGGLLETSPQNPLPVDDKGASSSITTQTGETVQLYYLNAGAVTIDAGQAAGVVVFGKLNYDNVKNAAGVWEASYGDTSLGFTSTALTTEVGASTVGLELLRGLRLSTLIPAVGAKLSNGQYVVLYGHGLIIGKKADTSVTLTSTTYKYNATAGAGSVTADITKVGGVTVPTAGGDAASNTRTDVPTSSRISVFNGTTWDRARSGIVAATSTTTGITNTLDGALYNTTKPTATNAQFVPLQSDVNGALDTNDRYAPQAEDNTNGIIATQNKPLAVSTYCFSVDRSTALEASTVTKASAGVIRSISGRIDSTHATGTYYLQVLNASSLPADGAVTTLVHPLKLAHTNGTDTNFSLDFTMNGVYASTGIVVCLSTTEFTKTISGAYTSTTVLYI